MEKTYMQKMSERTEKAAMENDIDELRKIHRELLESGIVEELPGMGLEFFFSKLTTDQMAQLDEE